MTSRVFIYARRSDKRKKWKSISIDDQKNALIKECNKKWFVIDKIIEENNSWFIPGARDDFNSMIEELIERNVKKKWEYIDYVFIKMPSRLSRNNIDTKIILDLLKKEIVMLYSLSDWETSSLVSMKKLEKDLIDAEYESKEKSVEGWKNMDEATKERWTICIAIPYWYKRIWTKEYWKVLINNDNNEADIVKEIFEEYSTWKYTCKSLSNHLNLKWYQESYTHKWQILFKKFTGARITAILKQKRYCGIYTHTFKLPWREKKKYFLEEYPEKEEEIRKNKITIDYTDIIKDFWTFKPIISKFLFNACQNKKGSNRVKKSIKKSTKKVLINIIDEKEEDYIFKWILRCNCKKEITNDWNEWFYFTAEKQKVIYDFYKCSNNNSKELQCSNRWWSWIKMETLFNKEFLDWITFSKLEMEIFESIISKQLEDLVDWWEDNSKLLKSKLKQLKIKEEKFFDNYMDEEDPKYKTKIKEKLNWLEKEIGETENELMKLDETNVDKNINERQIKDYIFYISSLWTKFMNFPKFRKREIIQAMFEYVVVYRWKVAEYKLNPVFEFAYNQKKFDADSLKVKKN